VNFFGTTAIKTRKIAQTEKSRKMVRLTGESSRRPILIKGNANAQKIIGRAIIR
jgi:hypothetical protein